MNHISNFESRLIKTPMLTKDIIDKVRRIEITTNRLVTDTFAGAYHSVFKGRGMEFDEVREYYYGDDIRAIDWNVTARTGKAHIKKYTEERELTVMIVVDASASVHFGSTTTTKNKMAAEIAAVIAFSAIRNNDKVGLLIFTDEIELFIAPKKGKSHVLRVIREILYFKPKATATRLSIALEYLTKVIHRHSVTFIISDFFNDDFNQSMRIANKYHDLVAITLNDPREIDLPACGLVELRDPETGDRCVVDTDNPTIQRQFKDQSLKRFQERDKLFDSMKVDHIDVDTEQGYINPLVKFFKARQRGK